MRDDKLVRRADVLDLYGVGNIFSAAQRKRVYSLPTVTVDAPSARPMPEVGSVIRALDSVIAEMHHLRAALRGLEDRG